MGGVKDEGKEKRNGAKEMEKKRKDKKNSHTGETAGGGMVLM